MELPGEGLRVCFGSLIELHEYLTDQLMKMNRRVKELSQYMQRLKLLCSVPGIRTLVGMELLVELQEGERFKRTDELASYIGLTPSKFSTGQYVRQGRIMKAKWLLLSFILIVLLITGKTFGNEANVRLNRGDEYFKEEQYDSAIAEYTKAIEINPKFAKAYNNRGKCYRWKGQYDLAMTDYNKAIEIDPKFAKAYANRGAVHEKKGKHNQAIADCTKAIDLDPTDAYGYAIRGYAYGQKGQHDLAIADYTEVIKINPKSAMAYLGRGNAYFNKGQYDHAIADYTKAIEIDPKDAMAYTNRGNAYGRQGQYNRAWQDLKKAKDLGYQIPPEVLEEFKKASGKQD